MKDYLEQPFEYLKRKDGSSFSTDIIKNWYKSRAFVLSVLGDFAFSADDNAHLHVVIDGDSSLMLTLARQVALSAHYINYVEDHDDESQRRRTVITVVSQDDNIVKTLMREEYLGHLLEYCKYQLNGKVENADSYVDLEFEFVKETPQCEKNNSQEKLFVFKESDVLSFCDSQPEDAVYRIDTRKAQYAGRMYELGVLIENLPAENIHDAHRYTMALDLFQYEKLQDPLGKLVNEDKWKNLIKAKNGLSNVFCADCFESRKKSMELSRDKKQDDSGVWEKYNEALCKSEHARWVVEKLIMGFRPFNDEERIKDEILAPYKEKRKQYRDGLKNNESDPAHIDLCSYVTLRRINPDDMKYDGFLMLAIPKILEKI